MFTYWSDTLKAPMTEEELETVKSPHEYPYSHSPILCFDTGEEARHTVYHDRMMRWDFDKYEKIAQRYLKSPGQAYLESKSRDLLEKLLQGYFANSDIRLVRMIHYCRPDNGYPNYRFDYYIKGE
ncbi:hypothetical protein CL653_03300 [bacterium]|nr:hypothetical protein [bacterium]|tara:strand:- start:221 stop:595 length:375 start_codon:yes stop_codon:yes gene_type:complete